MDEANSNSLYKQNGGYAMSENTGSAVSYLLVGLGVGAVVGIFFAPKSGKDTRKYLVRKGKEGRKYTQHKIRELREEAEDVVERGKEVAESISGAVDAGRDAYQRLVSKAL
jgi:gas vesicle protein